MLTVINQHFQSQDIVINLAALNDFAIATPYHGKLNKLNPQLTTFNLVPNLDVLKVLGKKKQNQLLIGFSAQETDDLSIGASKLKTKNLDAIVINNIKVMGQNHTKIT